MPIHVLDAMARELDVIFQAIAKQATAKQPIGKKRQGDSDG